MRSPIVLAAAIGIIVVVIAAFMAGRASIDARPAVVAPYPAVTHSDQEVSPDPIPSTPATAFPRIELSSPYLGATQKFSLPLNGKPTIVFLLDTAGSLVPMELIRGIREAEAPGDALAIAVVFVGSEPDRRTPIEVTLEQRGLLESGLRSPVRIQYLSDPRRELWTALEKPRLPVAMLVAADGSVAGQEIFLGPLDLEKQRIDACLNRRPFRAPVNDVDSALKKHPFYSMCVSAAPLPPSRHRDNRMEVALRLDAPAITKALLAHDQAGATMTIDEYVDRTSNFTLASRFAQAIVDRVGPEQAPRAAEFLKSGADGYVQSNAFRDSVMINIANASADLAMSTSIHVRLYSRWDNRFLGQVERFYHAEPGSCFYTSESLFQGIDAGWGDYRIETTLDVTMSSGAYPNSVSRPTVRRISTEYVLRVPRNEYAEDAYRRRSTSVELDAFWAGLNEASSRTLRLVQESSEEPGAKSKVAAQHPAVAQAVPPLLSKAFPGLNIARWLQGRDGTGAVESGGTVSGFGTRVVLLDFMFVDCPPCRALLPTLSKLEKNTRIAACL